MKKKILLIDDDDEWRHFAETELRQAGFEVVVPDNIFEYCTIRNLRQRLSEFDLIIVDAVLQKADAIDILYRIKEAGQTEQQDYVRATISVSARLDIETAVKYTKMGVRSISPKPYDAETLLLVVQAALSEIA